MTTPAEMRLNGLLKQKIKIQELEQVQKIGSAKYAKLRHELRSNAQEIAKQKKILMDMI